MRHFITTFIILLLLSSCIDSSQHGIEGDWLGYEETFFLDNDTMTDNFHLILSIDKDSIRAINFKYISHGNRDSLSKSSYIVADNNLIVTNSPKSPDTLKIEVLNDSAMTLTTANNKYKYSRLSKSKHETQKIELVEKMFTISDSTQVIDTIEFLDNSTILTYNSDLKRPNDVLEWRIRNYLGHKFLIIDSREIPVFLLIPAHENDFELQREPNEVAKYILQNIEKESGFKQTDLIGEWTGKSNIPDNKLTFIFDYDSVQMNEFTGGEMVTATYSLNLSGTKMFCFHKYASGNIFYEIEKIKNDSLFLKRLNPFKDSFVLTRTK